MITLGIGMIVKDEELVMERFLNNFSDCVDQIVIVDTGSTDKTMDIIKNYIQENQTRAEIILLEHPWNNNFGEARNYAFEHVTTDYVMWMDADDVIDINTYGLFAAFDDYCKQHGNPDQFTMEYLLSRDANGQKSSKMRRLRIVKNDGDYKWEGHIHECIVSSKAQKKECYIEDEFYIEHRKLKPHGDRNLKIFESMIENGDPMTNRDQVYYGHELFYNGRYEEAKKQYQKCFEKYPTWYGDAYDMLLKLIRMTNIQDEKAGIAFRSFFYGPKGSRPDFLCIIGDAYFNKGLKEGAIVWYEKALEKAESYDYSRSDIIDTKYLTWYPYLYLSLCYWDIDYDKSKYYHQLLRTKYPDNSFGINNDKWFQK